MVWQTSSMIENGRVSAWCTMEFSKRNQYLNGEKIFAIAPMIDWTDGF